MKTIRSLEVLLTVILGLTSCSTPMEHRVTIENFSLSLPSKVNLAKVYKMEDFSLYKCTVGQEPLLDFYVGNAPRFPHEQQASQKIAHIALNGMRAEEIRGTNGQETLREVEVELSETNWPCFVHFWYSERNQQQSEIADAIINSIRQQ